MGGELKQRGTTKINGKGRDSCSRQEREKHWERKADLKQTRTRESLGEGRES